MKRSTLKGTIKIQVMMAKTAEILIDLPDRIMFEVNGSLYSSASYECVGNARNIEVNPLTRFQLFRLKRPF